MDSPAHRTLRRLLEAAAGAASQPVVADAARHLWTWASAVGAGGETHQRGLMRGLAADDFGARHPPTPYGDGCDNGLVLLLPQQPMLAKDLINGRSPVPARSTRPPQ